MRKSGKISKNLPKRDDIFTQFLKAREEGFKDAFETAVRTGTRLIFYRNGKIIKYKPPFKYVMIPANRRKKKVKS